MKIQLTGRDALDRYFQLMEKAPKLFANPSSALRIIKDRDTIEAWMRDSDFVIGIV